MREAMQPLEYNGKPMTSVAEWLDPDDRGRPLRYDIDEMAEALRNDHRAVIRLEPGDVTRYDLVLVRVTVRLWLVVRLYGLEPEGACLVEVGRMPKPHEVAPLAAKNAWTVELLQWYLGGLMTRL